MKLGDQSASLILKPQDFYQNQSVSFQSLAETQASGIKTDVQATSSMPELAHSNTDSSEQASDIKPIAQAMTFTPEEDEDAPRTEDIPVPVSDAVYRGVRPFRM